MIQIVGINDTVTIKCDSDEHKKKLINSINVILDNMKDIAYHKKVNLNQNDGHFQVLVCVVGTEERSEIMISHTIYITEITIDTINVKIFLRYS
jgi:hypothetical protein